MRRTLADAKERILENLVAQTQIRENLGADYILMGSVVRPASSNGRASGR